jgi:hypothetical protein
MATSVCTFQMTDGGDAVQFFAELDEASQFREADLRATIEEYRTEIEDKTMYQGVDYAGAPFAAYAENGPYYYNPSPGGTVKQQKGAVNRLLKRTGLVHEHLDDAGKGGLASGGAPSRTGRTIRFASYGDFKRSLGRKFVDLLGPKAPQMLMNMVVQMFSATEGAIGIYNEPFASIAEGHNEGGRHLPQRRFLDITRERAEQMERRMLDFINGRVARIAERAR